MTILWTAMGLCLFSFVNALVYRLPNKMDVVRGRSICPFCKRRLKPRDLVPVASWVLLRGRCRYCHEKISLRYPLTEIWGGICGLLCVKFQGVSLEAGFTLVFLALLTAVSQIDMDTMEIPDCLNGAVFVLGMVWMVADAAWAVADAAWLAADATVAAGNVAHAAGETWADLATAITHEHMAGMLCVSLPMYLLICLIPGAFGGGDVKLAAGMGVFLGMRKCLLAFLLGTVAAGVYGMTLLLSGKKDRKDNFAFGPFFCGSAFFVCFWGMDFLKWYIGLVC